MRIVRQLVSHILLTTSEDRVFAAAPIPAGGRFLSARGVMHMVSGADVNVANAVMVSHQGNVVLNPVSSDATIDEDELWDIMVPKDASVTQTAGVSDIDTDIDTADIDTTPFEKAGLPNMTRMLERGMWGERVFRNRKVFSFADTSDGFKDATPDTFRANGVIPINTSRQVRLEDSPGYVLFAVTSQELDGTTGTVASVITDHEYLMLKYLDDLINDAWQVLVGLDESGAESPGIDIANFLVELTEPLILEETAGAWAAQSFNCWSDMQISTYTPGRKPSTRLLSTV